VKKDVRFKKGAWHDMIASGRLSLEERKDTRFEVGTVWKWLRQNHKAILIFFTVLAMGAGIVPTIKAGQRFVEALQFEKMAEATPRYAVVRSIEAQTRYYVLSVENLEGMTVLWVLSHGGNVFDDELDAELYTMFVALAENCPAEEVYVIIVAEPEAVPLPTGYTTALHGMGFFSLAAGGVEILIGAGIENASESLGILYGLGAFDNQSLGGEGIYMINLLPRAPGHVVPWEAGGEIEEGTTRRSGD